MENIETSRQLLKDIIHNANIGQDAVHFLLEKTSNPELQDELHNQEGQYLSIMRRAEEKLRTLNAIPEIITPLAQNGMWMGAQLSTLVDARDMHLTDIITQGNEIGKPEAEERFERYGDTAAEIREIASELIRVEKSNPIGVEEVSPHQNLT